MDLLEWGEPSSDNEQNRHDIILDPLNLDYDVSINLNRTELSHNLRLKITMKRKLMRSFIEIISPPAMLVVVSWVKIMQITMPNPLP